MPITLDEQGLTIPASMAGSYDLYVDDQYVWSFAPTPAERVDEGYRIAWPNAMKHWLDGHAVFSIREDDEVLFEEEVSLGSGEGRISFVDPQGIPVMIDKWGLLQRPFSGRDRSVIEKMVDITSEIIDVLARELDVHCWLAFGSLLGAAREGKVIGHDSDVDLAYLSDKETPVELNREMFEITRALRRAGMRVVNKSGSFVTVMFNAPDGGVGSIDVYSTFYMSGLLHETATVRADVPREAILPLGTLEFEGRELPVPADPDTMLEVSYGPNWRVPDPSFSHQPPPSTTTRFDGWFGSLMPNRREWERWGRLNREHAGDGPTDFGAWALARVPEKAAVVDIGAGTGRDVLAAARAGHRAYALDYARGSFARARKISREEDLGIDFSEVNLYSHRDAITRAALIAHGPDPRAVLAGGLLDAIEPRALPTFFSMLRLLVGRGGRAYLEFAHDLSGWQWAPNTGGARYEVSAQHVRAECERIGGRVVRVETVPPSPATAEMARTRFVVHWKRKGRG